MTASTAYACIVLSSLFTAACVWAACWRWWSAKRLPEHLAYARGFDACSRIRDREEVQARKQALLNIGTSQVATSVVVGDGLVKYTWFHTEVAGCQCEACKSARSGGSSLS